MFLFDAQCVAGAISLLFKINGKRIGVWKIPKSTYVLSNCEAPPELKHKDYGETSVKGIVYGDQTQSLVDFQKIKTDGDETNTIDFLCSKCKYCKFYDTECDLKVKSLFDAGIELYKSYVYKGFPFVDQEEHTMLDLNELKLIPTLPDTPTWKDSLSVVSVAIETSPNGDSGPIIPIVDELTRKASGWTTELLEYVYGYTLTEEITIYDGKNIKKFTRTENNGERAVIMSFLDYFAKLDPDVVQFYNVSKLVFLHQRCKHLNMERHFLETMNRPKVYRGLSLHDLSLLSFTPYYSFEYQAKNVTSILNYTDYSKEKSRTKLVGRILFNYFATIGKKDPFSESSSDLEHWHPIMSKALSVVLSLTGSYHMPLYYFSSKTVMTQWIVKKETGNLVYRASPPKSWKRSENSQEKKNKLKLGGGSTFEREKVEVYYSDEKFKIVSLDMAGFYPNIVLGCNLDSSTLRSDDSILSEELEEQTRSICGKRVVKSEHMVGFLPRVMKKFLDERKEIKLKLTNTFLSSEEREMLDIRNKALKEACAIAYGCLGGQWDTNLIAAPAVSTLITEIGREIWANFIAFLQERHHKVIHGTTDGAIVYTAFAKNLSADLKDFKAQCEFVCFPEVRETLKGVFLKDKQSWIGLDASNTLINKGVIRSQSPEVQIFIERPLFSILLESPPSTGKISEMLKIFQELIAEWSTFYDPMRYETYFDYYFTKNRKSSFHFAPQRYSEHFRESMMSILSFAHPDGVVPTKKALELDALMKMYMPI